MKQKFKQIIQRTLLLAGLLHSLHAGSSVGFAQTLTRGPYLQAGSTSAITIRWRTSTPENSVVWYGTAPTNFTSAITVTNLVTDHSVRLAGLSADTQYFYAVGTTSATLSSGENHFFVTAPASARPTRIWIVGNPGTGSREQTRVFKSFLALNHQAWGDQYIDLWLTLGNNGYNSGDDYEYQTKFFDQYASLLPNLVLWSSIGNKDMVNYNTQGLNLPYFQTFSVPGNGEAGGVPSNSAQYYSFDYGNIHFISLDSCNSGLGLNDPMRQWLINDLQATTKEWLIVLFHHSPYTKGSSDSDSSSTSSKMRSTFGPILEQYGVDLVLTAQSHSYERSYLIDRHYGFSNTLEPINIVDKTSGNPITSHPYIKPRGLKVSHSGTVYAVLGCSGKIGGGSLNHPVMYKSLNVHGSMVIDVDGDRLDARFVTAQGTIADHFAVIKAP